MQYHNTTTMKKTILITALTFISFFGFAQTGPEDILSSFLRNMLVIQVKPWKRFTKLILGV